MLLNHSCLCAFLVSASVLVIIDTAYRYWKSFDSDFSSLSSTQPGHKAQFNVFLVFSSVVWSTNWNIFLPVIDARILPWSSATIESIMGLYWGGISWDHIKVLLSNNFILFRIKRRYLTWILRLYTELQRYYLFLLALTLAELKCSDGKQRSRAMVAWWWPRLHHTLLYSLH